MSRAEPQDIGLFSESELSGIQPTGSAWAITPDDPATVPVPLQIVIVNVEGPYTARDRKLWTFLLHAVFDDLENQTMHEISVHKINAIFRELGGEHGHKWIWESAKRLAKTTVEWEYTLGDERVQGISSIFGAVLTKAQRQTGRLHFHFPPLLIPIIKHPMRFARLRVHFLLQLSGKYAVTLYEILEGFANRRDGECRVTLEELRTWLKVPPNSYTDWKDFKKRVLDPAIKQINDDPMGAGFSVEYEPIRKGRFYHEIVFKLTKTKNRIITDRTTKLKSDIKSAKRQGRPFLSDDVVNEAASETHYYLDMDKVKQEFWEHWEYTGKPKFHKGVAAAFKGFTKKKYGQAKYGKK